MGSPKAPGHSPTLPVGHGTAWGTQTGAQGLIGRVGAQDLPWFYAEPGLLAGSPQIRTSSSAHWEGSTLCEGRQKCWQAPRL